VAIHRQRLNQQATSGKLWRMPKPTIAQIPGPAAGAGLALALACDLRYAADTAIFTTAFARVAFAGDYGGTYFLTQLVGPAKAKELYYFSERLSAEQAEALGLVNAVFPPGDLEKEVMDRARRLAEGPSIAYRYMKENIDRAVSGNLDDCLDLEVTHHIHTGLTEDHREAARAFVEKREPRFHGR
jgi:2-(1,2-epoxy-1,2-dihydrophenyl)acetyl-CoA isomerase